jgi:hypothetical protein
MSIALKKECDEFKLGGPASRKLDVPLDFGGRRGSTLALGTREITQQPAWTLDVHRSSAPEALRCFTDAIGQRTATACNHEPKPAER